MELTEKNYTAKDFLEIYLEFLGLVPKQSEWNEEVIFSIPPRLYRFRQLKSLMKAFEIGEDLLIDFKEGGFLSRRENLDLSLLFEDMEKYVQSNIANEEQEKSILFLKNDAKSSIKIRFLFKHFFKIIEETNKFININDGIISSMPIGIYFTSKTNALIHSIDNTKFEELKILLCSMIDSEHKTFSRKILIEKYNFPDVDLEEIDMEWW